MTTEAFDRVIARFDPPLVVVTTASDGEPAGCLVGFHAQASIEPELYAVWLSRANHTTKTAVRAEHLAVHVLDQDQLALAGHFGSLTGDQIDKFAAVGWSPGPHGLPLLDACPARLVLRRVGLLDAEEADHVCWLGAVEAADLRDDLGAPLRLSAAAGLEPGHEAAET